MKSVQVLLNSIEKVKGFVKYYNKSTIKVLNGEDVLEEMKGMMKICT